MDERTKHKYERLAFEAGVKIRQKPSEDFQTTYATDIRLMRTARLVAPLISLQDA